MIADDTNAYNIATELTEYVHDSDSGLAREAVRAIGRVALEVSGPLLSEEQGQCRAHAGFETQLAFP